MKKKLSILPVENEILLEKNTMTFSSNVEKIVHLNNPSILLDHHKKMKRITVTKYQIKINQANCIACMACYSLDPTHFEPDENNEK